MTTETYQAIQYGFLVGLLAGMGFGLLLAAAL